MKLSGLKSAKTLDPSPTLSYVPRPSHPLSGSRGLVSLLLLSITLNANAQSLGIARGQDLQAWREIQTLQLEDDRKLEAYRQFIEAYPESSLAEVAWSHLVEVGVQEWASELEYRALTLSLERSRLQHEQSLGRLQVDVAVVALDAHGRPLPVNDPRRRLRLRDVIAQPQRDTGGAAAATR